MVTNFKKLMTRKRLLSLGVFLLFVFFVTPLSNIQGAVSCSTTSDCISNYGNDKFACYDGTCLPKTTSSAGEVLVNIPIPVVGHAIYYSLVVFTGFVKLLISLAAFIAEWALNISSFSKSALVTIGWSVTRSAVNMLFSLVLLGIAFATILRIESYGIKKLLPKLIIVALLINFSLFIGGIIIDFSQVITNFFISKYNSSGVFSNIMNGLNLQKLDQASTIDTINKFVGPSIKMMLNEFLALILNAIAFFVFLFLGLIFLIRVVVLWILLILSPIAWVFSIVPGLSNLSSKWWRNFIEWTFIAPAASFFIFLAAESSNLINQIDSDELIISGKASLVGGSFFTGPLIFEYLTVIGLLLGAIMVGKTMGGSAATIALKGAHGTRKFLGNQALKLNQSEKLQRKEGQGKLMGAAKFGLRNFAGMAGYGARYEIPQKAVSDTLSKMDTKIVSKAQEGANERIDKIFRQKDAVVDQYEKNVSAEVSKQQKSKDPEAFAQALSSGLESRNAVKIEAALRNLYASGDQEKIMETIMANPAVAQKLTDRYGIKPGEFTPEKLKLAMYGSLENVGVAEKSIGKALTDLSGIAKNQNKEQFAGMTKWSKKKKMFIPTGAYEKDGDYYAFEEDPDRKAGKIKGITKLTPEQQRRARAQRRVSFSQKDLKEDQEVIDGKRASEIVKEQAVIARKAKNSKKAGTVTSKSDGSLLFGKDANNQTIIHQEGREWIEKGLTQSHVEALKKGNANLKLIKAMRENADTITSLIGALKSENKQQEANLLNNFYEAAKDYKKTDSKAFQEGDDSSFSSNKQEDSKENKE